MKAKVERKQQEAELKNRMTLMVERANTLRNEAAQKMDSIPKAYELIYGWKDVSSYLECVLMGALAVVWFFCFVYWMEHDSYIPVAASATLLAAITIVASAYRNRPYRIEDEIKSYYVNMNHYDTLNTELQRLTDGIADYDRQYEEQKEYIQKFRDLATEVGDYAGTMDFVLKAGDFHVSIKMSDGMDELDCRLSFTQGAYEQFTKTLSYFNSKNR